MIINVKIGTIPYGPVLVQNKRNLPKVGETIFIRTADKSKTIYEEPWKRVVVDKINEDGFYFVSNI